MALITLLSSWWFFWLIVSFYNQRLIAVSDSVFILVVMFLSSLFFGGLLKIKKIDRLKIITPNYSTALKFSLIVLFILFCFQIPTFLFLIMSFIDGISMMEARNQLFNGDSLTTIEKVIFNFISAIFYNYLLITSIAYLHIYKKKHILILMIIYLLTFSMLKGSRAEVYQFFFVALIYFSWAFYGSNFFLLRKYWKQICFLTFSAFSIILFVGMTRNNPIILAALDYHTVSFGLLSEYLNTACCFNEGYASVGISYFGGIDYIVGLFARVFYWPEFQSFMKYILTHQNDFITTHTAESMTPDGKVIYALSGHNAFYTLLVSGYHSFGNYGVILMGFLLGLSINNLSILVKKLDLFSSFYLLQLICCLFMGIFSSNLETVGFWLTLMLLNAKFSILHLMNKRD